MFQARNLRAAPAKPLTVGQKCNHFLRGHSKPTFRMKAITLSVIGASLLLILTNGLPLLIG